MRAGLILFLCWFATVLLILLAVVRAEGHPGRLAADGCHRVFKDFTHVSGNVDRAGSRHCHRPLGEMKLDGLEQLQEDERPGPRPEDLIRPRETP